MTRRAFTLLSVTLLAGCLEQPKPNALPRTQSLYTRLGGEGKLAEIVERFAVKVTRSPEVSGPIKQAFAEPGGEAVKRKLVEQLGAALGGPYEARPDLFLTALQGHVSSLGAPSRKALKGLLEAAIRETVQGERLLEDVNKALGGVVDPGA
jgi:truncated hemoglobin YjbI